MFRRWSSKKKVRDAYSKRTESAPEKECALRGGGYFHQPFRIAKRAKSMNREEKSAKGVRCVEEIGKEIV